MQSISKCKKIIFLLCVINVFSEYAWVFPLKDKKGTTITNAFQWILDGTERRKPTKIWIDNDSKITIVNLMIDQGNHGYKK